MPGVKDIPGLAWWEGAGEVNLEEWQYDVLQAPFKDDEVLIRFDGIIYLPWHWYHDRMLRAFRPCVPQLVPISPPYPLENSLLRDYVLLWNGAFVGHATGECVREGGNQKLTVGSAIEATASDALSKIGKRYGMARKLWDHDYQEWYRKTYGVQYQSRGRVYWRKK